MYSPESYGRIGVGADAAAINAAAAAAQAADGGVVVLSQPYAVESTIGVAAGPAVHFWGLGAGNRQVNPDALTGGYVRPADGFGENTPLFSIGRASAPTTNPCGTTFWMPRISGTAPSGTAIEGCTGIPRRRYRRCAPDRAVSRKFRPPRRKRHRRPPRLGHAGHGVGFCVTGGIISSC